MGYNETQESKKAYENVKLMHTFRAPQVRDFF